MTLNSYRSLSMWIFFCGVWLCYFCSSVPCLSSWMLISSNTVFHYERIKAHKQLLSHRSLAGFVQGIFFLSDILVLLFSLRNPFPSRGHVEGCTESKFALFSLLLIIDFPPYQSRNKLYLLDGFLVLYSICLASILIIILWVGENKKGVNR